MAEFCPNLSIADAGHLQILNISVEFWMATWYSRISGSAEASLHTNCLTRLKTPTRCWKLALGQIEYLTVCHWFESADMWHFQLSQIGLNFSTFSLVLFLPWTWIFARLVHLSKFGELMSSKSRPSKQKNNNSPTRVTMPFSYLQRFLSFSPISFDFIKFWPFSIELWILNDGFVPIICLWGVETSRTCQQKYRHRWRCSLHVPNGRRLLVAQREKTVVWGDGLFVHIRAVTSTWRISPFLNSWNDGDMNGLRVD